MQIRQRKKKRTISVKTRYFRSILALYINNYSLLFTRILLKWLFLKLTNVDWIKDLKPTTIIRILIEMCYYFILSE
jgi:hypothetical protein